MWKLWFAFMAIAAHGALSSAQDQDSAKQARLKDLAARQMVQVALASIDKGDSKTFVKIFQRGRLPEKFGDETFAAMVRQLDAKAKGHLREALGLFPLSTKMALEPTSTVEWFDVKYGRKPGTNHHLSVHYEYSSGGKIVRAELGFIDEKGKWKISEIDVQEKE